MNASQQDDREGEGTASVVVQGARGKREVEVLILNILKGFVKKRIQNSGGVSSEKKSMIDLSTQARMKCGVTG